jgi:hypothetical protein
MKDEMLAISDKEVWTYKGDTLVLKLPRGLGDLTTEFVDTIEIWLQLHHVPPTIFTTEGLKLLTEQIKGSVY